MEILNFANNLRIKVRQRLMDHRRRSITNKNESYSEVYLGFGKKAFNQKKITFVKVYWINNSLPAKENLWISHPGYSPERLLS